MPTAAKARKPGISPDVLGSLIKAIEKKKLGITIHRGDEVEDVYRVPCLSYNMMYATNGGAAIGRWNLLWGPESSYKTRMAYEWIAQAQILAEAAEAALWPRIKFYRDIALDDLAKRLEEELEFIKATWPDGMECVYWNVEQQYDKKWAEKLGIDTHRLIIMGGTIIEEIVETMETMYGIADMHVVDSTSNATSQQEMTAKHGDKLYGPDARAWKSSLRKSMAHWDDKRNIGILINQASTNVRTGGNTPVSTRYLRHTSSLTIKFEPARFLYPVNGALVPDKPEGADDNSLAGRVEPAGKQIFAQVEKSRVTSPFRIAALHARFGAKTFDHMWELINAGLHFGIIYKKSGGWYFLRNEEKSIGQGEKAMRARLDEDEELAGRIFAVLMHSIDNDENAVPVEDLVSDDGDVVVEAA